MFLKVVVFFVVISYLNVATAVKDFERCNVGHYRVHSNLSDFDFNYPKRGEYFRLKYYVQGGYPFFKASDGVSEITIGSLEFRSIFITDVCKHNFQIIREIL